MDTNKMREQFLAWLDPAWNRESFIDDDGDEVFTDHWVQGAWVGWVASREAVVVELPQVVAYEACYDSLRDNEYAGLPDQFTGFDYDELLPLHRSDEVRSAIEAQGLKVKL